MEASNGGSVRFERMQVTPELAQEWLDRTPDRQRRIMPSHVNALAAEMRGGQWNPENAAPIQLARGSGWAQDGRHRLAAVVETGRPQWFYIAHNADPTTFDIIDAGRPRSAANVLEAEGVKNSTQLQAVARLLHSWLRGAAEFRTSPSRHRVLDLARQYNDDLQPLFAISERASKQTAAEGPGHRSMNAFPKALAAFCAFLELGTDSLVGQLADWPDEDVANHEPDAAHTLRDAYRRRSVRGLKTPPRATISLFILAKNVSYTGAAIPARGFVYQSSKAFPMPEWPVRVPWGADHVDDGDEDDQ